jgi:hypothetical protein
VEPRPLLVHEPALDAEAAARLLRGQEVHGLSAQRLLGRLRPDRLRGLDLLFVPHWYCSFRVVLEEGRAGRGTADSRHIAPAVWTMVEALAGNVLRLPDEPRLVLRDLAALAPAVVLPATLGREVAVAKAMHGLRWDLRVRGRQRLAPRHLDLVAARLAHVPFWLGYYTGPGGQVRARALHGVERSIQDGPFTRELLRVLETVA